MAMFMAACTKPNIICIGFMFCMFWKFPIMLAKSLPPAELGIEGALCPAGAAAAAGAVSCAFALATFLEVGLQTKQSCVQSVRSSPYLGGS